MANKIKPRLYVAGYPSNVGGADTELQSLVHLWIKYGIEVHLVPMFGCNEKMKEEMDSIGAITHKYESNIFKDQIVVSLCNGEFLKCLPEIISNGRPAKTIWLNCMTWLFDLEKESHQKGWIDLHGYQSTYQKNRLLPELSKLNKVNILEGYRAPFEIKGYTWKPKGKGDHFCVGRISRDDPAKFGEDTWHIMGKILSPRPVKSFILGYSDKVEAKIGKPPEGLDWQWWTVGGIPSSELYSKIHCLIHKTGGSRENWPRVVLESFAHGVVPIVENDYGFTDMITDGVDGFLCSSSNEMSYRASQLAFDDDLRLKMAQNGFKKLQDLTNPDLCIKPWLKLLDMN